MAGKEIKQKIVLEGEKEYSQALKDANRNLKTLRSELKAETAELGNNATAQQKAETRTKNLKKQIAEQEKVVRTYQAALQEVREKYADNEDAIASWEQKLNNARATLGNMRNELDGVGHSLKTMQTDASAAVIATKSVADSIGQIASAGEAVSDKIENIFTGLVGIIRDAFTEVWALVTDTAAKANDWTDIAGIWNTSPQTIQQWARAVQASANSFGDLEANMNKIVMGDHDKIAQLTGVSWMGDVDQWQYAIDVMSSLADMDYTRQMHALEEIFGDKRATKIKDILNDWQTIQELVPQFNGNTGGYGLSDEGLAVYNEINQKVAEIEEKWDALKAKVAEGLGVGVLGLTVNVQGALDGVADFLSAESEEDRQKALEKIRTNLETFFTKLGEIVAECIQILHEVGTELQNSDDPVTKAIGDILTGLTEALDWIIKNQEAVKAAFTAIFGAWLLAKLAAVAGKLTSIVASIETIKLFKGWNSIPLSNQNTGTGTGTGTGVGAGAGSNLGVAQNVTTQTVTTQSVTSATVGTIPSVSIPTANVTTMYVQTMIGGQGGGVPANNAGGGGGGGGGSFPTGLPQAGNGNSGALPDGSGYTPGADSAAQALPSGGGVPIGTGGGSGLNGFIPLSGSGGGDLNLTGGNPTVNIEGANPSIQGLPSGEGGVPSGSGNGMQNLQNSDVIPGDGYVTDPSTGKLVPPNGETAPELSPPKNASASGSGLSAALDLLGGLAVMAGVTALAVTPAAIVQNSIDEKLADEAEMAEAVADEAAKKLADEYDGEIARLRRIIAAVGPRKGDASDAPLLGGVDEEGYLRNIFGGYVFNPGDDWNAILQGLGDPKNRGLLHADIEKYGYRDATGTLNTGVGWTPWNLLLRYWGEYSEETWTGSGDWRHVDDPLDPYEVDALLTYLRDVYVRKFEDLMQRLEEGADSGFESAVDEVLSGSSGGGVFGRAIGSRWHLSADQWQSAGLGSQQEGISSQDLQGFRGLPGEMLKAAKAGTAEGIAGIKVYMDGTVVGRLVAPTVSREIARTTIFGV